ncbi:MAG: M20/M25/M40 family metallo-hydrolase [Trueperaceae bacterium]
MRNASVDSLTGLIADLVRIDSVNPSLDPDHAGEARIARFVAEWAEARGLTVEWLEGTPGRPSVVVTAKGSGGGANLLLNGHLDTVGVKGMDDPFHPNVHEGRMYGRGVFDMKASLAACLLTVAEASTLGLTGDVIFTAVADEEEGSVGTEETLAYLQHTGKPVAAAIVTEPSELQIQVAHRGFAVMEVGFEGKASHTAKPAAGVNALTHMGRLLHAVERQAAHVNSGQPHPLLGHGSLLPVLAQGGQELYTTPASATLTLERRTVPGESQELARAEINGLLTELTAADPSVKARVRTLLAREPFEVDTGSSIVRAVAEAARAVTGAEAPLVGAPYWTDAALVAAAGIPTVLYGPRGGGIHQSVEWVELDSVETVRQVLVRTARAICGAD